ncbi:MAG: nuclear transport factor 2 family protein [Acidimicrobiales bacterium]|nr:nuclear transport factor 2 family protein [Acidimicrobiales bacterium]
MGDPGPPTAADVVRELVHRFHAGDQQSARRLYAPGFQIQQPSSFPHGGWHEGLEGMGEMAATFAEHWDREIDDPRILDAGDTAVQITTQTWTSKVTGRAATVDVVELFTVVDGCITEIRVFQQDTHLLLETLEPAR